MPEILSQAEIDELLNALKSGTADEPQEDSSDAGPVVRAYDFRTANRFTKDQMRSLGIVFQNYSQLLSNRITNLLRATCECEVLSVEEMGYNEFNNSLPSPVILGIFNAPPLTGSLLVQVSPEVAYMLINRLLGGVTPSKESSKQFTEIELALIERFLNKIMGTFDESWEKVVPVRSRLERLETSTQFVQIASVNDAVVVGTMSLKIGEDEGLLSLCLPRASIEAISANLSTRSLHSQGSGSEAQHDEEYLLAMGERIAGAKVALVASFNETPATVADIISLQAGDVIRLNHRVGDPLLMKVQHIPKFYGKIGTSKSRYALQIVDIIEDGEEDEDEPVTGGD